MKEINSKKITYLLFLLASVVSVASLLYLHYVGYQLSIEDGRAHLDVARRVFDSLTPGIVQLGGIWLPLPHIIMFPLIWNDFMWHSGLAGAIPSMIAFILGSLVLFKFTRSFFNSIAAGIMAFIIYISSPNLLFIQAQPMTESFSMLFLLLTVFCFWKWLKDQKLIYIFSTSIALFCATLTRYEGWILPIIVVLGIIVVGLKRKWGREKIEGTVIVTGMVAFFGVFIWILFNTLIFHNPFMFLSGEGSAKWFAGFEAQSSNLPAKGSIIFAPATYLLNMVDVMGVLVCILAIFGLIMLIVKYKKYSFEHAIILMVLVAPLIFNIYSLFSGSSVMWTRWLDPYKIYNVRYVLLTLPLLCVLIGGMAIYKKLIPLILICLVAQIYLFSISGPLILFRDITQTSNSARQVVGKWLKQNPANGLTLISAGANEVVIFESGRPIREFIYEGNNALWNKALVNPDKYVSRIIMGSVIGPQTDKVYQALNDSAVLKNNYKLSYSKDSYSVYDISNNQNQNIPEDLRIRSVDTMKFSRDSAGSGVDKEMIEKNVSIIKGTNANYITVDTPYDEEFYPVLKAWVTEARKNNLRVWFRGNWSGWEGWFDYPKNMTREEHLASTRDFILNHPDLFKDGDIFTACPECEYGGPGSPLKTGDIEGYRKFMLDENQVMLDSFTEIGKDVKTNFTSINPDVAKAVLDKDTVGKLGNVIVIDHYVGSTESMESWLEFFHTRFPKAKIVLGEFGAPIPDINGPMTDDEQAKFIDEVLDLVTSKNYVIGINYWVGLGGSTAIFNKNYSPKPAADVLKTYFSNGIIKGKVTDQENIPLGGIEVQIEDKKIKSDRNGNFSLVLKEGKYKAYVKENDKFRSSKTNFEIKSGETKNVIISLKSSQESLLQIILNVIKK